MLEVVVDGHVGGHPLRRDGQAVRDDERRKASGGAEAVHLGEQIRLPAIEGRRIREDAAQRRERDEDRREQCDPSHARSLPWRPTDRARSRRLGPLGR